MRFKQIIQSTGKSYGHRQRTRPSYQVDQESCTYAQGRSSSYESRRGHLSAVESRLRPISWCDSIKTRKNWVPVPASSDEDLVMRSKRQDKVFITVWLWFMNLTCISINTRPEEHAIYSLYTNSNFTMSAAMCVEYILWWVMQCSCCHILHAL